MKYNLFERIQVFFVKLISVIHWDQDEILSPDDVAELKEKFKNNYYVIATRRQNYLTTFFINLGHFLLTGRWGYYSHVLMNLEDIVKTDDDYRFIEATTHGTKYSTFDEVFTKIDAVALLRVKGVTEEEWTAALDSLKVYLGRPYDNLFDLKNDLEINCVELIALALKHFPDHETRFKDFYDLIADKKTLTPQMFLECKDFEIVYEVRK